LGGVLRSLGEFFRSMSRPAPETATPQEREQNLRLAAAALLFEVVRADGVVKPEEHTVLRTALRSVFDLTPQEVEELVKLAERESREAVSIYDFTRLVDEGLSREEKKRIVELLWLVCFSDAEMHAEEEYLVRKIAGLLHVTHPEFIDAKLRARESSPARPEQG
jgi:uncharacterized tellurite resistance protein B-like protein